MAYENYQERRKTWLDYFTLVSLGNPYDSNGEYHPEHYLNQYLPEDEPNMKLMYDRLIVSQSMREKFLLELLIEEFDPMGIGLDKIEDLTLEDITIK